MTDVARLLRTLRYLKPGQILWRIYYRLVPLRPGLSAPPVLRDPALRLKPGVAYRDRYFGEGRFDLLGQQHVVATIEDWNAEGRDKLWLYNAHYFDDLKSAGRDAKRDMHRALIDRWIEQNPPAAGNGWEPYPTSLRIVNWIRWWCDGEPGAAPNRAANSPTSDQLHSLAIQIRTLADRPEYHILGNHLFTNAKALIFGGAYFDGPEAQRWLELGLRILDAELGEQTLSDGGNFERTPMYHHIILEDLLDLINLAKAADLPVLAERERRWAYTVGRMVRWAQVMNHDDERLSLFNDATLGIAPTLAQLKDYAQRLDVVLLPLQLASVERLPESGYVRFSGRDYHVIADVGRIGPDYLPGHAHADTLSFEMVFKRHPLIVNSGINIYTIGAARSWQRSTAAHSTVVINDEDSSEVWGGFRVARRAFPFGVEDSEGEDSDGGDGLRSMVDSAPVSDSEPDYWLKASHDGYKRLTPSQIHTRRWQFSPRYVEIADRVSSAGHPAEARYYLHPAWQIEQTASPRRLRIFTANSPLELMFVVEQGQVIEVCESEFYPGFGLVEKNRCIRVALVECQARVVLDWTALGP